ncbi:MAG TPA: FAD-dependent monooxygenase [Lacipirellulaceae bacterium]|jgi:2-polyprenyl-6-methoxyphenol hydroxylase-like FAD-dependent oxidoreductase|nr:FAD-dependent monooxygenase [Lacipirellulaceae bacterium]
MSPDVLIVGAGPVGLTMAAALDHHGLKCRIIDKAPAPSDKSKALVVWSRTLELLDRLQLADTFVAAGMKADGASMYANGERLMHISLTGVDSPFGFPLMLPQNETERLLAEYLAKRGVTVQRQIELLSFGEQPDGVAGNLRHADGSEESFTVPWLIGCDGAHSTVRHGLGLQFTGSAEPNDWFLADIHVRGPLAKNELSIYWHEKGVLVFFPIDGVRFRVIADLGTAANTGSPPDPTLAQVQAKIDERGPGGLTIMDPVWLAGFRINERKVTDYRRGRVMLAGDAAHIHSPAGGQGMNTGMQDAFNLAWKLALVQRGQGQREPLLESYSKERSAVGDQVLKGAALVTLSATLRNPIAQYLRNHIAPIVSSFGFVQDRLKNMLCELAINYRHGPLTAESWPRHLTGLAAGDRLPDAPLTSLAAAKTTTLFAELHGTEHTLLLMPDSQGEQAAARLASIAVSVRATYPNLIAPWFLLKPSGDPPSANSTLDESRIPTWFDRDSKLHEKLNVSGPALVLIRPDGYIGYRCQPADGDELNQHLATYLISTHE